jgi:DNA invertase Pin-like site-specific DNA recombinase
MNQQQIYFNLMVEFQSPAKIAETLKISRWTVYTWKTKPIEPKHIAQLEIASKFRIKRHMLRPDIYEKNTS